MGMIGTRDTQTVKSDGARAHTPNISGVLVRDLGNILTRSGSMAEVFRIDWSEIGIEVRQVNWVEMNPGAVTDWHAHAKQTDHLVGIGGNIKLALWDARPRSPTHGATDIIRIGAKRPVIVIVPPGVWHGLRNESGCPASYLNITDETYVHEEPDNWRAEPGSPMIPNVL